MKTKMCCFLTVNRLSFGRSSLKVAGSLCVGFCHSRPETFLKDARAFGLNSEVTKWKLYGLCYMRFRQDGPVGFLTSVFYVYAARAKMPSPCRAPCHTIPAVGSTWSGQWLSSSTGSSLSCLCQCGLTPSSELWHSSSPSPGCFVSLSRQETILF